MSVLRRQILLLRAQYQSARYAGDLASDVPGAAASDGPVGEERPRWRIGHRLDVAGRIAGSIVALAASVAVFFLLYPSAPGASLMPLHTQSARQTFDIVPSVRSFSLPSSPDPEEQDPASWTSLILGECA